MAVWDALLLDFEGICVDPPRGMTYHDGRPGRPASCGGRGLLALEHARALGVPVGLVSDGSPTVARAWFAEQGVRAPDVVIGHLDTVLHRPAPAPLLEALARLGVAPGPGVLSLGDGAAEVVAAVRAGVTPGTVSDRAPLCAPPSLYFHDSDAIAAPDLAYAAATRHDPDRGLVTLAERRPYGTCRVGGRAGEPGWDELLAEGRQGRWSGELVSLAHTLVIHALGARPREASLTWWPREDHAVEELARALRSLTTLPLMPPDVPPEGETWSTGPLAGRRVVVLSDVRRDGSVLDQAGAALVRAGASWVGALALAQVASARRRAEADAEWGPRRHVNDDLRRRRARDAGLSSL